MKIQEKHRGHPKEIQRGLFGPHRAKMICLKCRCWVKWISDK